MVKNIDYQFRIENAKEYLKFLGESIQKPWEEQCNLFMEEKLNTFQKLALLNPIHLQNIQLPKHIKYENLLLDIQGKRNFPKESGGQCNSQLIWGYHCVFSEKNLSCDHLFPYSLGGPTSANNKIILCKYHNMVKTSDIHLYPWEDIDIRTSWLNESLQKMFKKIKFLRDNLHCH